MNPNSARLHGTRIFIVSILLALSPVHASVSRISRWTPESMAAFRRPGVTALSPDGKYVAYTVSKALLEGDKSSYLTHIWLAASDGSSNRRFTSGEKSCTNPSFSPDGAYLAFVSARGNDGKNQVWIMPVHGGEAEQLTRAETGVGTYAWSPDGTRIAYTMKDPDTEEEKKNRKEKRDMRTRDADYKYSHLYTIDVERGPDGERKVVRLTSGAFHITSFDWSPDGKTIVFAHQTSPSPDTWSTNDISAVPSAGGPVFPLVHRPGADMYPKYSPDGRWIAFASDAEEPAWALLADAYVIPADGGKPRKLVETPDRNFMYYGSFLGWSADNDEIYVREADRTSWRILAIPVNGGKPRVVTPGPGNYGGVSFSRDGEKTAFVHETSETPPDVYVTATGKFSPVRLTELNGDFSRLPMGKTEVVTWKSGDGLEIEGLLTYPIHYEKGRRYPLILYIHGGPAGVHTQLYTGASQKYPIQAFAEEGYAVLRVNPRGSSGYGKDFRFANRNDWGFGDFEDLMTGVDRVIEMGVAHPDSLCVTGWSYGGYMTAVTVTKTRRFKAAVMGAGLSNLISFTGTSDIHSFLPYYFDGEFWDRGDVYIKHSPIFHVKGVTTPTLILHGEIDKRVPLSQGEEFYNALKRQGCPVELVVYPRTYHGPREPKFIIDIGERTIDWFNRYLGRKSEI